MQAPCWSHEAALGLAELAAALAPELAPALQVVWERMILFAARREALPASREGFWQVVWRPVDLQANFAVVGSE